MNRIIRAVTIERILGLTGDADPRAGADSLRLKSLRTIVLVLQAAETWAWYAEPGGHSFGVLVLAVVYTALAAIGFAGRLARVAAWGLVLTLVGQFVWTFPLIANHRFLVLMLALALAWLDLDDEGEARLSLQTVRWLMIITLFYAGLQKVLHGTYFRGQYLAYLMSLSERFTSALGWLAPPDELARLLAIGEPVPGAGPYTVDGFAFVAMANLVWIAEIVLAGGLLWRRTRRVSVYLAAAMMLAIEAGARELFFGVLYVNVMLVFLPGTAVRRLLPATIAIYVVVTVLKLAGVPWTLT